MAKEINLVKGELMAKGFVGFSWTVLFFGFFVPLIRGDWKYFLIMIVATMITLGFSGFFFIFLYNKFYTRNLLEKGYLPADDYSRNLLINYGFYIPYK